MQIASRSGHNPFKSTSARWSCGFTYMELLAAVVITGVGICAALAGVRNGLGFAHASASLEISRHLAESFRQYASGLAFSDPQGGGLFGPEEGSLSDFDDLDDLKDLIQTPPVMSDGTVSSAFSDWREKVRVFPLDPDTLTEIDPDSVDPGDLSLLVVVVTLERGGQVIESYPWLVADHGP
jgi:hypothetical protein